MLRESVLEIVPRIEDGYDRQRRIKGYDHPMRVIEVDNLMTCICIIREASVLTMPVCCVLKSAYRILDIFTACSSQQSDVPTYDVVRYPTVCILQRQPVGVLMLDCFHNAMSRGVNRP